MSLPLVELAGATVSRVGQPLLSDVFWRLLPGERWAVLGENGAGKSTFLKLVRGDVWPDDPKARHYLFDGTPYQSPIGAREQMALVSDEQQARCLHCEWLLTGADAVATGFFDSELLHQMPTQGQREMAQEVMKRLGISALGQRSIQRMSQGELRKVLIARALVSNPKVLLLDEVAAGLDSASRADLLSWLETAAPIGTGILMSTHRDEELLPSLSKVVQLFRGRVFWQGERSKWSRPSSPALGEGPRNISRAPGPGFLVRIRHADVFLGTKQVLFDINWEVREGENWYIRGDNGAGKSTLLKLVLGDLYPLDGGEVHRFNSEQSHTVWQIKRRMGYVSHELQTRFQSEEVTVFSAIASGFFSTLGLLDDLSSEQKDRVDALMVQLGLQALAQRSLRRMSYGQARKVLLARALVTKPQALLLDEPFDGLDASSRGQLCEILETVASEGTQLLMTSHHPSDVLPFVKNELHLRLGRVIA